VPEADADFLARRYGLTRREAGRRGSTAQGKSLSEVAATLSMTINTVSNPHPHLFAKTGVDRLSQLMRVLLRGPGVGHGPWFSACLRIEPPEYAREASVSRESAQVGSGGRPA
jgi:DNA-binding CsgD family transcriptional regulator